MILEKIMLLRITLCLVLLTHGTSIYAEAGTYKNLLIGIDPVTGVMTGAFHEERTPPVGPSFSCIFAIKGNIRKSAIKVGFPGDKETTQGEIRFEKKGTNKVFIRLDEQQPGCAQATPLDFMQGTYLELSHSKSWHAVMIVTAKKTYFHNSPDRNSRRTSYILYADCVGLLEKTENWAKVEYENGNRSTIGWVQLKDLGMI
jgi:hypothetical protein